MQERRLFVALQVSKDLSNEIRDFRKMNEDLNVHWIYDENLHLTLVEPWLETNVDEVCDRLDGLGGFGLVEVLFDDYVLGPDGENPYMLWLQVRGEDRLQSLKDRCEDVLEIEGGERDFRPHITLARFSEDLEMPEIDISADFLETFDRLVLMESHLSGRNGEYEVVHVVNL